MIQLVESASTSERLDAAHAFIESFPPATEILIVGSSREAADDLARQVTVGRRATFGLHRVSLLQLAAKLAAGEMARLGLVPTTPLGTTAIAARVSFEALRDGVLRYFGPVSRFPGFARALAATVTEVRLADVDPERVTQLDPVGRDLGDLLRRFEKRLKAGAVADRAMLLRLATEAAARASLPGPVAEVATDGPSDPLGRVPIVLLDVPIDSAAEWAFVSAVMASSSSVLFTVPAGDETTRRAVEELVSGRGQRPEWMSAAHLQPGRDVAAASDSDLARLRDYLFTEAVPPSALARGDVVLFSAPGEGREAIEIARLILEEARAGTPFDRMAVLLRAPAAYWTPLETALTRAGVPTFFAQGTRRPDPAGRAFLALLDCARERFSARRFAEYLSLGQVPPLDAEGAPPEDRVVWVAPEDEVLDPRAGPVAGSEQGEVHEERDSDLSPVVDGSLRAPWKWEELLVESTVIGGKDRWSKRLGGLETEYRLRLETLRAEEPDSPRVRAVERDS